MRTTRTETSVACGVDVTRPETVSGEGLEPDTSHSRQAIAGGSHFLASILDDRHGQLHQPRHYATPHRAYLLANESGTLAWRNRRNSTACSNDHMAWLGVVGTVVVDDIDLFFAWNLVEQLGQSVTVSHILIRH
ncbi:MAG: hypothetical protein E5299_00448 [Burkholderia gladioli]|nr:MAG: hypothetical protein E5299_00448 [Burkholderia gladioli]